MGQVRRKVIRYGVGINFYRFCKKVKQDPEELFIKLARGDNVQQWVKSHLSYWIEISLKREYVLYGEEKYKYTRGVKQLQTVKHRWIDLAGYAEDKILRKERIRTNDMSLRLYNPSKKTQVPCPQVQEIHNWIFDQAKDEFGLKEKSTIVKQGTTPADFIILIQTIWQYPDFIGLTSSVRCVSYIALLILASLIGARPGALENFTFEQIEIQLWRDPKNRQNRKLTATVNIPKTKLVGRYDNTEREVLGCNLPSVPHPCNCVTNMIIAPWMDDVEFLSHPWKKDFRQIFNMSKTNFSDYWNTEHQFFDLRVSSRYHYLSYELYAPNPED